MGIKDRSQFLREMLPIVQLLSLALSVHSKTLLFTICPSLCLLN